MTSMNLYSLVIFPFLAIFAAGGRSVHEDTPASSSRNSSLIRNLQYNDTPSYPAELSCDKSYTGFLDLTYTYSMETVDGEDIYQIIDNIEGEILLKLSKAILPCIERHQNLASDSEFDIDVPYDTHALDIVGVNSEPRDRPSELTRCVSVKDICTVVHGSLTLFLGNDADLEHARYASRYVINEAMKNDYFVNPRVKNLLSISYKGPKLTVPEVPSLGLSDGSGGGGSGDVPVNAGLSIMTKVIIGALFSAIVGIVAGFVLFKKVFNNKQNCFAACDGTGVERDYIEEAHFYSPHRLDDIRNAPLAGDDMETVEYDIANGLTVINEDSDMMSSSASYSMSTMTGYSNASRFNGTDVSMTWTDAGSVASEKTLPTSNRNRTPMFGKDEETEKII